MLLGRDNQLVLGLFVGLALCSIVQSASSSLEQAESDRWMHRLRQHSEASDRRFAVAQLQQQMWERGDRMSPSPFSREPAFPAARPSSPSLPPILRSTFEAPLASSSNHTAALPASGGDTPPPGYEWPPAGCRWSMINCQNGGWFNGSDCYMELDTHGADDWAAMTVCNCPPGIEAARFANNNFQRLEIIRSLCGGGGGGGGGGGWGGV